MEQRKQTNFRALDNITPPPRRQSCIAVSVIIPMYNAEKYVGECLDSLLAQTFQDFEVIVVDDCSTDSSPAIVERYAPKFGGRLTLAKTKKNSGNAGYTARNKGFTFSRGEYVYFIDADDFIKDTALEELYTAAKEFDADVVYTGARWLYTSDTGADLKHDIFGREYLASGVEDKPKLFINDTEKILGDFVSKGDFWTAWTKFARRNFLTENEISFYEVLSGGDFLWTIELFCCCERFLRIPQAVYFWRDDSKQSMTRTRLPPDKQIIKWYSAFPLCAENFAKLLSTRKIFEKHPEYAHYALQRQFEFFFAITFDARIQVSSEDIYKLLQHELERKGKHDLMSLLLFTYVDALQKNLIINQQQLTQLSEQSQNYIRELEKRDKYNKAYIAELEKFVVQAQRRITELENEISRPKSNVE